MTSGPSVLLSRLHHPVTALGPGRRAGIWFQGCSIRCRGCISADTWPAAPEAAVPVAAVLNWLDGLPPEEVDGITISGGEPTDQPDALSALLAGIGAWRRTRRPELPVPDVLVFTGRNPGWLDGPAARCLAGADAAVVGPYVAGRAGVAPLRGSDNQQLVALTPLGAERLPAYEASDRSALQVAVADEGLWLIGIPPGGTMAAFDEATAAHGVSWEGRSWLS